MNSLSFRILWGIFRVLLFSRGPWRCSPSVLGNFSLPSNDSQEKVLKNDCEFSKGFSILCSSKTKKLHSKILAEILEKIVRFFSDFFCSGKIGKLHQNFFHQRKTSKFMVPTLPLINQFLISITLINGARIY